MSFITGGARREMLTFSSVITAGTDFGR